MHTHENARASRNQGELGHIPDVTDTLADGISSWPHVFLADKIRELASSDDWSEQDIAKRGKGISTPDFRQKVLSQA